MGIPRFLPCSRGNVLHVHGQKPPPIAKNDSINQQALLIEASQGI